MTEGWKRRNVETGNVLSVFCSNNRSPSVSRAVGRNLSMSLRNLDCLQKHPMPKISFCAGVRRKGKRRSDQNPPENLGVFLMPSTALDLICFLSFCGLGLMINPRARELWAETDYHLMGYMDMLILQMPIADTFIVFNVHSALKLLLKEDRNFIWLIIRLHALEKDPRL